jgi:CheY-like chemotaxis protein
MLGGDLSVMETQVGVGTRMRLTMAAGQLEGVRMIDDPAAESRMADLPERTDDKAHHMPGVRILLAEDGHDNQRLIKRLLTNAGTVVTLAIDGHSAVEKALSAESGGHAFDVILMDMQMPTMDGYRATRNPRAADYTVPIIALTANAMNDDHMKCLAAGCDDFAGKPVDSAWMFEVITRYVTKAQPASTS